MALQPISLTKICCDAVKTRNGPSLTFFLPYLNVDGASTTISTPLYGFHHWICWRNNGTGQPKMEQGNPNSKFHLCRFVLGSADSGEFSVICSLIMMCADNLSIILNRNVRLLCIQHGCGIMWVMYWIIILSYYIILENIRIICQLY